MCHMWAMLGDTWPLTLPRLLRVVNAVQRRFLEIVKNNADRLSLLVNDLLA